MATRKQGKTAEIVKFEQPTQAIARREVNVEASSIVAQFAQAAADPNVSPEKLNAMLDFQVRVMSITAKQAFDRDFALMQGELPVITKTGVATVTKDGQLIRETSYTRNVDISKVCRPIMGKYGFALRFRNKVTNGILLVTGILSHRDGHSETDEFESGRDDGPGRNLIQSWGSARAYGKRYCTISLLDISSTDEELSGDDDGAATGEVQGVQSRQPVQKPKPAAKPQAEKKATPPARAPLPSDDKVITQSKSKEHPGQLERLWTIIRNHGRNEEAVRTWLQVAYGIDSTRDIKRKDYDEIIRCIESKDPLPMTRKAGQ
jgi:hypothetical protein